MTRPARWWLRRLRRAWCRALVLSGMCIRARARRLEDATCGAGGMSYVHGGRMSGNVDMDNRLTRKIYEKPTIHSYRFMFEQA